MKKILLISTVLLAFNLYCFSEITTDSIWGVWDYHVDKYPYETLQTVTADKIEYLRMTWGLLIFNKYQMEKPTINYQGGYYYLEDYYKQDKSTIILKVRIETFLGEVAMHFIDDNHVWFEILYNEHTDKGFPKNDFRGKDDILTRMPTIESMNIKEISLNEGDLMYCNDNLRLRTQPSVYYFDTKVIVSMKKGTKVKVLQKYMWQGYIDNILADWVEIEVVEDSFDKDGKPLPKGTRGWCFGAYLTLLESNSK